MIHHLAVDAVSWRLIREDLESAYFSLQDRSNRRCSSQRPPRYQAWAQRLAGLAGSGMLRQSSSFWIVEANKPVRALPAERDDCANLEGDAVSITTRLTGEETRALLATSADDLPHQINDVLLAALGRALQQWTGGDAFVIDLEGHGREDVFDDVDLSRTVGWFTTLFPVRLEMQPGIDEGRTLKSVKDQLRRIPDRGMSYGLLRYFCDDAADSRGPRGGAQVLAPVQLSRPVRPGGGRLESVQLCSRIDRPVAQPGIAPDARTRSAVCRARRRAGDRMAYRRRDPPPRDRSSASRRTCWRRFARAIAHCLSVGAGGPTPSDFPLAALSQEALDRLWARHPNFEDVYPLTPMQRLFYAMESVASRPGVRAMAFPPRWSNRRGAAASRSIEQVVARHTHPAYCVRRPTMAQEPLQVVLRRASLPWSEEDWRAIAARSSNTAPRDVLAGGAGALDSIWRTHR